MRAFVSSLARPENNLEGENGLSFSSQKHFCYIVLLFDRYLPRPILLNEILTGKLFE